MSRSFILISQRLWKATFSWRPLSVSTLRNVPFPPSHHQRNSTPLQVLGKRWTLQQQQFKNLLRLAQLLQRRVRRARRRRGGPHQTLWRRASRTTTARSSARTVPNRSWPSPSLSGICSQPSTGYTPMSAPSQTQTPASLPQFPLVRTGPSYPSPPLLRTAILSPRSSVTFATRPSWGSRTWRNIGIGCVRLTMLKK